MRDEGKEAGRGARKGEGEGGRKKKRERKGFTVRETNVRGKRRWRDGHVGGKLLVMERKREVVTEGAEQAELDR